MMDCGSLQITRHDERQSSAVCRGSFAKKSVNAYLAICGLGSLYELCDAPFAAVIMSICPAILLVPIGPSPIVGMISVAIGVELMPIRLVLAMAIVPIVCIAIV